MRWRREVLPDLEVPFVQPSGGDVRSASGAPLGYRTVAVRRPALRQRPAPGPRAGR
jgi:hypothetical protein